MSIPSYTSSARLATMIRRWVTLRQVIVVLVAIVLGLVGGAVVAFGPFWAGFVGLAALALGYAMLKNTDVALALVFCSTTILPFGTLPFKAVVTPNFLELALLALLVIWVLRLLVEPESPLFVTPLGLPLIGFLGITVFSFLLGSQGSPDSLTLHNYFKFVLAVLFFFSVANCVRSRAQVRLALRVLMISGAVAGMVGLVLYVLRDDVALQLLTALGRIGYPTSGRVLRFIEDDPNGIERAIGFAVDPNSFGGMLALVGALTATQVVAERPILSRPLLVVMAGVMALALFLTYSRAALGGLIVATVYVATVRYRRLWWVIVGAGLLAVFLFIGLGVGEQFVERVTQGVQFRDQANQMRLAEYRNALDLIGHYPFFGIGFGQAPELDLVAGVSNIYLALAERTGLLGLVTFLGIVGAFFVRSWRFLHQVLREQGDEERVAWLVGLQAALAAALAVGMLDHYFFNIEFSHMVALFWGTIALALTLEQCDDDPGVARAVER